MAYLGHFPDGEQTWGDDPDDNWGDEPEPEESNIRNFEFNRPNDE